MYAVRRSRQGFTLVELLVVIAIIALLAALVLFGLQAAKEAARKSECVGKINQLAMAVRTLEGSLRFFPTATTSTVGLGVAKPGSATAASLAGYSWIVQILDYTEEKPLAEAIKANSTKFVKNAFDPLVYNAGNSEHASSTKFNPARCPSYSTSEIATASDFTTTPKPAIGNYVAWASSHMEASGPIADGALIPPTSTTTPLKGRSDAAVIDGMSKTLLLAESKETKYGSWYDGTCTWVTGIDTTSTTVPTAALVSPADGFKGFASTTKTTLNVGPINANVTTPYLVKGASKWAGAEDREWGPSSNHAGVVVMVFLDRSTKSVNENIDANVLYRAITVDGKEPTDLEKF